MSRQQLIIKSLKSDFCLIILNHIKLERDVIKEQYDEINVITRQWKIQERMIGHIEFFSRKFDFNTFTYLLNEKTNINCVSKFVFQSYYVFLDSGIDLKRSYFR